MKPAYYMLAATLLGLVAFGLLLSLEPKRATVAPADDARTVFVNLDSLMTGHPAIQRLEAAAGGKWRSAGRPELGGSVVIPRSSRERDSATREELELTAAQAEVAALGKLESDLYQALEARIRSKRGDLTASSAAETDALMLEARQSESEKRRRAEESTAIERINALLKVKSLQAALKVPGVDQKTLRAALTSATDEFGIIETRRASERRRMEEDLLSEIRSIRGDAAGKVAEVLSSYEASERARIASGVNRARTAFLEELSTRGGPPPRPSDPARVAWLSGLDSVSPALCPQTSSEASVRVLADRPRTVSERVPASDLRESLRRGVARCVVMIGRERGYKVVFARRQGLRDETDTMRQLLIERGLACWGAGVRTAGES